MELACVGMYEDQLASRAANRGVSMLCNLTLTSGQVPGITLTVKRAHTLFTSLDDMYISW